jgi:hypothetical protein
VHEIVENDVHGTDSSLRGQPFWVDQETEFMENLCSLPCAQRPPLDPISSQMNTFYTFALYSLTFKLMLSSNVPQGLQLGLLSSVIQLTISCTFNMSPVLYYLCFADVRSLS